MNDIKPGIVNTWYMSNYTPFHSTVAIAYQSFPLSLDVYEDPSLQSASESLFQLIRVGKCDYLSLPYLQWNPLKTQIKIKISPY